MLVRLGVNVIWDKLPRPTLLSSAVAVGVEAPAAARTVPPDSIAPAVTHFGSKSLRWFGAVVVGAAGLAGIISLADRYLNTSDFGNHVRVIEVATRKVAPSSNSAGTPQPLVVSFGPEMLQITAISLGHPRLAVINGRTVAEGDTIVVHGPTHSVAVSLRVTEIADGYVDLFDGVETVRTQFALPSPPARH
jgi:hypothetical protein